MLDKRCVGCLKLNGAGECMAFTDVKYQHNRKGGCYGRVTDPNVMAKMYEDLARYVDDMASKIKYKKEAQRWRKING